MTDDEAFIRAIVDAPGDDAPRLIYADWLDERGDPRGHFLRREVEFFRRPGDGIAIEWVREPIDRSVQRSIPIWGARVSRPPVGVCCDRVVFFEHHPSVDRQELSESHLDVAESRLGLLLPADFRAFLLNYNGGAPEPSLACLGDDWAEVKHFHTIWLEKATLHSLNYADIDLLESHPLWLSDETLVDIQRRSFLEIGRSSFGDRTSVCIAVDGPSIDQVFLVDPWTELSGSARKVADSFSEFLSLFGRPIEDYDA